MEPLARAVRKSFSLNIECGKPALDPVPANLTDLCV
jgi:hypothetical protein